MLQEGDGDALWGIIKAGFTCVPLHIQTRDITILIELYRVAVVLDQVPWLPYIVKLIPAARKRTIKMQGLGLDRARARFEAGAQTKDLFYYLASPESLMSRYRANLYGYRVTKMVRRRRVLRNLWW